MLIFLVTERLEPRKRATVSLIEGGLLLAIGRPRTLSWKTGVRYPRLAERATMSAAEGDAVGNASSEDATMEEVSIPCPMKPFLGIAGYVAK